MSEDSTRFPCPFCKKVFKSPNATNAHFRFCKGYKRWRNCHTETQFTVFMRTNWRKRIFHPGFSATKPTYPTPIRTSPEKSPSGEK